MGEENQTILKEDPSDPKRRRAPSHVEEGMRTMRGCAELSRKGYSSLVRQSHSHCLQVKASEMRWLVGIELPDRSMITRFAVGRMPWQVHVISCYHVPVCLPTLVLRSSPSGLQVLSFDPSKFCLQMGYAIKLCQNPDAIR